MTKTEISKYTAKIAERLGIGHWDIKVKLCDDYDDGEGAAATCRSNHIYMHATIKIYKCAFEKHNDLKHIIKHEVCHCVTDPFQKICYDLLNAKFKTHLEIEEARERLTETIARLL